MSLVLQAEALLESSYVLVAFTWTGIYEDKPSHSLPGTHFKDHVDGLDGNISPQLLDVTIFVSPTATIRHKVFMKLLGAQRREALATRIEGVTEGVASQYSAIVNDDILGSIIIDDEEVGGST